MGRKGESLPHIRPCAHIQILTDKEKKDKKKNYEETIDFDDEGREVTGKTSDRQKAEELTVGVIGRQAMSPQLRPDRSLTE